MAFRASSKNTKSNLKNKPLLLLFNWNTHSKIYFEKFNFKSKKNNRTKSFFIARRGGARGRVAFTGSVDGMWKEFKEDKNNSNRDSPSFVYEYNSIELNDAAV